MRGPSVLMLGLVVVLTGCSVHVPGGSAKVGDGVHVDVGSGGGGGFCPPGQAKKGNC